MNRIIILVGSVRKGGNTERLAGAFAKGVRPQNEVEIVSAADCRIHPCTGCNRCFSIEDHACVQDDGIIPYMTEKTPLFQNGWTV